MITIVPFRLSYLKRVIEIERACFPEAPYPEELFRQYHERCGELFVVLKRRSLIAGYMITFVEGRFAEVISIAVHPDWQRQGLGSRLMDHSLQQLRQADVSEVSLMVREADEPSLLFYEKFGFQKVRKVKGYYQDGSDAVRMSSGRL